MKKQNLISAVQASRGFSLVELLVVITILAIISTVAYTNLTGSTEKAKNSKRIEHLASMETAVMTFRQEKQYLPMPADYIAATTTGGNVWGYDVTKTATAKNTVVIPAYTDFIASVTSGAGGGKVFGIGADSTKQIGAKGVMDQAIVGGKQYLSQDITDPVGDIKVSSSQTLKDYGIGRYAYAIYAKPSATWNSDGKSATAFNVAVTLSDDQKGYVTKIGGDFDDKYGSCAGLCPYSLIGAGGAATVAAADNLKDGDSDTKIPYGLKY